MSLFEDNPILDVLVLGNSSKFIEGIKSYFPDANLIVVSWRSIGSIDKEFFKNGSRFDLVFVCGYDYESYSTTYDEYLNANVYSVLAIISSCENCRKIVYVDTEDTVKRYTFSRYVYAKKLLGKLLAESTGQTECHIMMPCTIVTDKIDVHCSWLETGIFNFLKTVGKLETVSINVLFQNLLVNRYIVSKNPSCPIPICLKIQRTRLIDRGLRFLYG